MTDSCGCDNVVVVPKRNPFDRQGQGTPQAIDSDTEGEVLRLGFACAWWQPREPTWSYIPERFLAALRAQEQVAITPIDTQRPLAGKAALALTHRLSSGNAWQHGLINRWLMDYKVHRIAARFPCDAVVAMGLVEPQLSVPTFFYQDMGFSLALAHSKRAGQPSQLQPLSLRRLRGLAVQEQRRYEAAAGVFTMGTWFAQWLIEHHGLSPDKVHPVGGGLNAAPVRRRARRDRHQFYRLLFVGRDFFRKGGDLVVAAVERLRAAGAGPYQLTVVGPATWPLKSEYPDWVDFRGSLPPAEVGKLWASHDMFVLPSRFEAYGLAFLEARAAGLPCVARDAYAMPELVPEGRAGTLVPKDGGVDDIAAAITRLSTNHAVFEAVEADADRVAQENSWDAVATRTLNVIKRVVAH